MIGTGIAATILPAMPGPPRLETRGLTVARGGRTVARAVDLRIEAGEVVALVGPSGAGKSSLLRALVRLDEPAGGTVLVDGADTREIPPTTLRRRVGFVAQQPVMLPGTVRENLAYGLDDPAPEGLADSIVAAGLAEAFLERPARELSGGEAARTAVARALVREPVALLLDEPTAALDSDTALGVARLVGSLAERGLAVLVVTHDAGWARAANARTLRLADGGLT
jgi:ABC-type multidrug transport system fused ATPase/permease subunit